MVIKIPITTTTTVMLMLILIHVLLIVVLFQFFSGLIVQFSGVIPIQDMSFKGLSKVDFLRLTELNI